MLCSTLRDLAVRLGAEARLPSVLDLCARLDVAKVTLDGALRRLEAEGVLVCRQKRGIFVSPTIGQKTVAAVFGGDIFSAFSSPFWPLLLEEVRRQVPERGQRVLGSVDISQAVNGLGRHEQLVEDIESRRIDGMLLLAPVATAVRDEVGELAAYGVPLVVFGSGPNQWTVGLDWASAFSLAARELAAHGCRRVALMGIADDSHRRQLAAALQANGLGDDPLVDWAFDTWAHRVPGPSNTREMIAHGLAQQTIAGRADEPLPDGLVSLDDTMTRGVVTALLQAGMQPGRDLLIATTANKGSPVLEPYAPDLILIEYDPAACMHAALDMLGVLVNGGTPPDNRVLIAPALRGTGDVEMPAPGTENGVGADGNAGTTGNWNSAGGASAAKIGGPA